MESITCIGCGHTSRGKLMNETSKPMDLEELRKARDTVFEAIGWRKVPGGWKCNNCTGIRGATAKW